MTIYKAAEEAFGGDREMQKKVLISKLTKKQRKVYDAIQRRPEAVNDDAILQAEVWQAEGWDASRSLEDNLRWVTRAETLSRRRRELFNLGLIEYSPKAMKSREQAFKNERDRVSPLPPDHFLSPESLKKAEEELDNLIVRAYEQESLL